MMEQKARLGSRKSSSILQQKQQFQFDQQNSKGDDNEEEETAKEEENVAGFRNMVFKTSNQSLGVGKRFFEVWLFSLKLCLWALPGFAISVIWHIPMRYSPLSVELMMPNFQTNETATLLREACIARSNSMLEKTFCSEILGWGVIGRFPAFVMVPLVLISCLKLSTRTKILFALLQVTLHTCLMEIVALSENSQISVLFFPCMPLIYLVPSFILYFVASNGMWGLMLKVLWMQVICIFMLISHELFYNVSSHLVFLCVLWPVQREITYFLGRRLSKSIIMRLALVDPNHRSDLSYFYVLTIQVFLATWFRVIVTTITDEEGFTFFIIFSSVTELVLRITVVYRDKFFSKLSSLCCCCCHMRSRTREEKRRILPQAASATMTDKERQKELIIQRIEAGFYAMVSIGEMLSEYIAILYVCAIVIMFRGNAKLLVPLPIFQELENPFVDEIDINGVLFRTFLQIAAEIFVDSLCSWIEVSKFRSPLFETWLKPKMTTKLLVILLGGLTGTSATTMMILAGPQRARTISCDMETLDLCSCKPAEGSLYLQFCLRLYPETNGLPVNPRNSSSTAFDLF